MGQANGMLRSVGLLILGAAVAAGCSEPPKKWSLVGFDELEADAAMNATVEWCQRTGGGYCPTVTGGDNHVMIVASTVQVDGVEVAGLYQGTRDLTPDGSNTILIRDRREQPNWLELLRRNMLHELGHASSGREDHLPLGNIMEFGETTPWHLTDADVAYGLSR